MSRSSFVLERSGWVLLWLVVGVIPMNASGGVTLLPTTRPTVTPASKTKDSDSPKKDESEPQAKKAKPEQKIASKPSGPQPQIEIYIPSVSTLVEAAARSRTADLVRAFAAMFPARPNTDNEIDPNAILKLLRKPASWPDTSLVFTTYTQDREGRPRWALAIDWPLADTRKRIQEILDDENAKKLLQELTLKERDDGTWQLETPDLVLAVIRKSLSGTLISSAPRVSPPETVFGQSSSDESQKSKKKMLLYCSLNLKAAEDDDESESAFSMIASFNDLRYGIALDDQGLWNERLSLRWNMLVGGFIKAAVKKVNTVYDCPAEAYVNGAIHLQIGEAMAEGLADLPSGTLGSRVDDEMAFSIVPGTGFLPIPDSYFQFNATGVKRIIKSIRKAIEKDNQERQDEDIPIAWRELDVDGIPVFYKNDTQGGGLFSGTFRPVIFFEPADEEQEAGAARRMIVVNTSTDAESVVRRWLQFKKDKKNLVKVPESKDSNWQVTILWKQVYSLVEPYLALLTSGEEDAGPTPTTNDLSTALADSKLQLKIDLTGLDVRHRGPLPFGAAYVPIVTGMSLSSTGNPNSEAQRERIACRQLRVLHHHARLFKKDYGRWPANVAEMDGYVDFKSHPYLLNLQPKDKTFMGGFTSMFTAKKESQPREDNNGLDDSLYEIDVDEGNWKLQIRPNEFVHYKTIYIDQDGDIHRVTAKTATTSNKPKKKVNAG